MLDRARRRLAALDVVALDGALISRIVAGGFDRCGWTTPVSDSDAGRLFGGVGLLISVAVDLLFMTWYLVSNGGS